MEVCNDILGYKNRKIFQSNEGFKFSLDSVMLANFVSVNMRDKKILDLGTGNAVIPLILSLRTKAFITGVEIQKSVSLLARKSVFYNNLDSQIDIVNMDMKEYSNNLESDIYDIITCNPPFFKYNNKSFVNLSDEKLIARHEVEITLSDIFCISRKLLKNGGKLAIVHRVERLMEILEEYRKNNIEPKRIRFVYENLNSETTLVLIEGTKNGKTGLKVEKPFIMFNYDGSMTDEYSNFLKEVSDGTEEL